MPQTIEQTVEQLLRRASVACGLARALAAPDQATHAAVLALQQGAVLPEGDSLSAVVAAWRGVPLELLADEHTRLFGPATQCPPWETAWGDARRLAGRTTEMADVAGMYRAFGLKLSDKLHERPDHIVAELEFIGALLMQLGWALADGKSDNAAVTRDALALFLDQHAGRWVKAFAAAVESQGASPAYAAAAKGAAAFIEGECARTGALPRQADTDTPCKETEPDCMACPMAAPQDGAAQCGVPKGFPRTVDGVPVPAMPRHDMGRLFGVK